MMFAGETPWHGLGTRLENPATSSQAIEAAGLNYRVDLRPIETDDGVPVPQRRACVRADSNQVLGVVGTSYRPVQNRECFGFLDSLVADGELRYHTVGALGQGERVWMLAKLPGEISVLDSEDITEKYLLLSNSHDGSSCLRVFFTPIRVVCANTLAAAERRAAGQGVSIVHRGNIDTKVTEAREMLGLANQFFDVTATQADALARYKPSREELDDYFRSLYSDRPGVNPTRSANVRAELFRLFEEGRGQQIPAIKSSVWAAFNAVTEYVDHHRPTRTRPNITRAETRLHSSWFGAGASLKAKAWMLARSLVA